MKKKIAIIGAGIAGLTLANFLKKEDNIEFKLYEKDSSLSLEEGYGIQLTPNSISILNKISFNKIIKENYFNPKFVDFYSIENKKICGIDINKYNTEHSKYTTLKRSTLIEFLKDEIYTQYLRFGKSIKEISEIKEKILIKFEDNTNDLVDYVIGADGVFSNTKTFFEKKKSKPIFQKAIAIRTILKNKKNLIIDDRNINLFMGSKAHLVLYPINKKNELNLVSIIREKKYEPSQIRSSIDKLIISQNPNLKDLFESEYKSFPLFSTSKISQSSNNKVFYIGDAFNSFLPTMAQGANQSIESAFELFNLIKNQNSNISNVYFKKRSERVKTIKRRSNFNFFIFHLSNSILQKLRNSILKFLVQKTNFIDSYIKTVLKGSNLT